MKLGGSEGKEEEGEGGGPVMVSSTSSSAPEHPDSEFKKMYLLAVDYGLSLLGKGLGDATLTYLKVRYGISMDQTIDDPKALCLALESTLGFSSITIEKRIIRSLYSQIGYIGDKVPKFIVRLGHPDDFANSIQEARKAFAANKSLR